MPWNTRLSDLSGRTHRWSQSHGRPEVATVRSESRRTQVRCPRKLIQLIHHSLHSHLQNHAKPTCSRAIHRLPAQFSAALQSTSNLHLSVGFMHYEYRSPACLLQQHPASRHSNKKSDPIALIQDFRCSCRLHGLHHMPSDLRRAEVPTNDALTCCRASQDDQCFSVRTPTPKSLYQPPPPNIH